MVILRVGGAITDPAVIRQILEHLHLWAEPPTLAPARAPPQLTFDDGPRDYDEGRDSDHTAD